MRSELVMFLFMAHRGLPEKMASILNTKLKHNDVASLKDLILEKAQDVLEELEGSQASVNRMYHRPQQARPQYNRSNKPRAPQSQPQNLGRLRETQDSDEYGETDYFADSQDSDRSQQDFTMTMKTMKFTRHGTTNSQTVKGNDYSANDENTEGPDH